MIPFRVISRIAIRNVWRNKKRSLLTIGAIGVGILSSAMLSALQVGSREQIELDSVLNLLGHIKIANSNFYDDPVAINSIDLPELKLSDNYKIARRVKVSAIVMSERKSKPLYLVGITPSEEKGNSVLDQDIYVGEGLGLTDDADQGLILGESLIEDLKTKVGRRVVVLTQDSEGKVAERGFKIKASYRSELESVEKAYGVGGLKTIQQLLKLEDRVSDVSITLPNEELIDPLKTELKEKYPEFEIRTWKEVEPFVQAVVKLQNGVLILWYGIVLLAVFFGVINTLFMMVFEREREFCLYRALGLGDWSLTMQLEVEMFFLLLLGAVFGIILSYIIIGFLSVTGIPLGMFSEGTTLIGIRSIIYPKLVFSNLLFFLLLIFFICMFGSIFPARRAIKLSATQGLSK